MTEDDEKQGANDAAKTENLSPGQPTLFREKYIDQAYQLALLGLTNDEMASVFGVARATFYNWQKEIPEFLDAIKSGKAPADGEVVASLRQRALGYSHAEMKVFLHEGKIVEHVVTKHYPPDTAAMCFWLKNRQRRNWLESFDMTSAGEKIVPQVVTFADVVAKKIAAGSPDVGVEQPEIPVTEEK